MITTPGRRFPMITDGEPADVASEGDRGPGSGNVLADDPRRRNGGYLGREL